MEKTKEEIVTEEAKKAFMHYFIHRGNQEDINWEHEKSHWFVAVVSKYIENAYNEGRKEGFESFREKAEEGVKKHLNTYGEVGNELLGNVLTTINDLKHQ